MRATKEYQNKKVLVLGLARSGVAVARLLTSLGADVTVNDRQPLVENPVAKELLELGLNVIGGSHPLTLLDEGFDLIVKNPGIPYTNPILEKAIILGIPIITEVEVAYHASEAPFIGITGTNGKTTTTTMIYQMLQVAMDGHAKLAGNIGFPTSQVVQDAHSDDYLVTELSSFQLMGVNEFKPQIAVLLNLYDAHLDYHGSREAYHSAKWNIQQNMTVDNYLVLNYNQEIIRRMASHTVATVIPFTTTGRLTTGAYVEDGIIYYNQSAVMPVSAIGVPGEHNIENALAAVCVAKLCGVSNQIITSCLTHFSGVPHRTEYIGTFKQRKVYNDSKATNLLATEKALNGFDKAQTLLIAGGLDRGNTFTSLIPALTGLKGIVVYGETKEKLAQSAKVAGVGQISQTEQLTDAVTQAFNLSQPGDIILFSPACASWDQFADFEVRGDCFKEAVQNIK